MDAQGNIVRLSDDEIVRAREILRDRLEVIPEHMLAELQAMNRHDRRAWYAKQRKKRRTPAPQGAEEASMTDTKPATDKELMPKSWSPLSSNG